MTTRFFWAHGELCAAHPWEVIVATLTLTACMLTVDQQIQLAPPKATTIRHCAGCLNEAEYIAADVIVMTIIRCLAVLYSYYQFCNLHRLGSKYILGIAGLFTVFSSFVFTSTVLNFLRIDMSDLKDAMFFFLLLIDLSKAGILAEFALSASNHEEVKKNIARGMSLLGPSITLDTIVETLVIGVGTLSGVHRLEMLSCFACLSVIVNYAVFMTFYPACLSLILELSRAKNIYGDRDLRSSLLSSALKEENHKSNPVVQRVKLIMSAGLMLVHAHRFLLYSWWPLQSNSDTIVPLVEQRMTLNRTDDSTALYFYIMKWVTLSADHIVILILLLALVVKFIFFENKDDIELRVQMAERQSLQHHNVEKPHNVLKNVPVLLECSSFDDDRVDKAVQTSHQVSEGPSNGIETAAAPDMSARELNEIVAIYKGCLGASALSDDEIIMLVDNKHIPPYQLESAVGDYGRGVSIRRKLIGAKGNIAQAIVDLPYKNYDYSKVMGACCENVVGYIPVPVGIAGPLLLDDKEVYVPMATTEGCLVASTSRGCRALIKCGIKSRVVANGMTRGPVVRFPSLESASAALAWLENAENYAQLKKSFDSSSRFARLTKIHSRIFGRLLYIRFVASTGDAMGMNMLSKGTESALNYVLEHFPEMEILSLSGNFCTDKKPAAVNWIEGRGKSVVCEAIVPREVVRTVLKTTVDSLVDVNIAKNMIGSAAAGSIGGFNAHAANIVTAIFIATGQDPAQNVGSSNCMTIMEKGGKDHEDLYISCTMPSIEVGTVGGGTILSAQASCLEILGVRGANEQFPGANSNQLARIVCGTVLAGELSLMGALAAGHLVQSHLRHNRSSTTVSQDLGDLNSASVKE